MQKSIGDERMNFKDQNNKSGLEVFKADVLQDLDLMLTKLINSSESNEYKKGALICYWLKEFKRYLEFEGEFDPSKLKRYERGDVIKVNFGFNIGNEHGGLHYSVVLDNGNYVNSGIITVVPLMSKKKNKTVHHRDVDLGDELYIKLKLKHDTMLSSMQTEIKSVNELILEIERDPNTSIEKTELHDKIRHRLDVLLKELDVLEKVKKELDRMKQGSVALVEQVSTVSKIRIYDPKSKYDVLAGVKISPDGLDSINSKMVELFMHQRFNDRQNES